MENKGKIKVEILKDLSESVPYDTKGIPLHIRTRNISQYVNMRSFPHWHSDIEIMYIIEGKLNFNVNGQNHLLSTGECIVLNCKQMHHSASYRQQDCTFFSFLFRPQLFTGNTSLYNRFVLPILQNPDFEYCYFYAEHPFYESLLEFIKCVMKYKEDAYWGYEIKVIGAMHKFWIELIIQNNLYPSDSTGTLNPELKMQRDMLSFIHQHYMEKITLNDIAAAGNVCRSRCCSIFKQYMNYSPIDFLNYYRLETSCKLLEDKSLSITDVAISCGLIHNSYYSQLFKKTYGCSPREYRERLNHV